MTSRPPSPSRSYRPAAHAHRAGAGFVLALVLASVLAAVLAPAAGAAPAPALDRAAADRLAASPPSSARDARLAAWAKGAGLEELLWVLRRDPVQLGRAELALADAAIKRTSGGRTDLLRRLTARRWLADPAVAAKAGRDAADLELLRPRTSVYRVAALLPDRGDYAAYATSVRAGLEAGLAWGRPGGAPGPVLEFHGTGDGEPAVGAAVLDTVSRTCAVLVGDLLSVPTTALAAGARVLGLPLVSTTATDESIGRIGPMVFQVGPANVLRGDRLARSVIRAEGAKVVILTSSAVAKGALVDAFAAAAESLGAKIVRRDTYAPGTVDFRTASRGLKMFAADVLFWDGESREADALLRQIAADGVSVKVCGGTSLAPDQFHGATRPLLEGITWVADDWRLPAPAQALVDSLARVRGEKPGPLWVRGFLAGRRIADAVDAGARTPSELAAKLRHASPALREWGFLDCGLDGATLPVFTVSRGKTVDATP